MRIWSKRERLFLTATGFFIAAATTLFTLRLEKKSISCDASLRSFITARGDDGYIVTKYLGTNSNVTIPAKIDGVPVVMIDKCAFYGNMTLNNVVLPQSLKRIGDAAFGQCTQLTNVVFPQSLDDLGGSSFSHTGLREIRLPKGLKCIKMSTFAGCVNLQTVLIPEGVSRISMFAFLGCRNLSNVSLPSSVSDIDIDAFGTNTVLKVYAGSPVNE